MDQEKKGGLRGNPCPHSKIPIRDIPGGAVVKNLPSNAGDAGLIPGWRTKIPHASGQPSPYATTAELECHNKDPMQPNK